MNNDIDQIEIDKSKALFLESTTGGAFTLNISKTQIHFLSEVYKSGEYGCIGLGVATYARLGLQNKGLIYHKSKCKERKILGNESSVYYFEGRFFLTDIAKLLIPLLKISFPDLFDEDDSSLNQKSIK